MNTLSHNRCQAPLSTNRTVYESVLMDGVTGDGSSTETTGDIEAAIGMAPGLTRVLVVEGKQINSIIEAMTDNSDFALAHQATSSWDFYGVDKTTQRLLEVAALQGLSFFQSSGDAAAMSSTGRYIRPTDPVDDLRHLDFVTIVGGTVLTTDSGAYVSEMAWNGSGGGPLASVPIPYYQVGVDMSVNFGSTTNRDLPDVAMVAVGAFDFVNGAPGSFSGTSLSSPLWAGFMARINEQGEANGLGAVGFANPFIYKIGLSSNYSNGFNDIQTGSNGWPVTPGYDMATGWGTPKCGLIELMSPTPVKPPAPAAINHIGASGSTDAGPRVCMNGSGFKAGAQVGLAYAGIPGRQSTLRSGFATVERDGTFSLTDTSQTGAGTGAQTCTDAELISDVTVTASDGTNSASATLPTSLWCGNGRITEFGGGCP